MFHNFQCDMVESDHHFVNLKITECKQPLYNLLVNIDHSHVWHHPFLPQDETIDDMMAILHKNAEQWNAKDKTSKLSDTKGRISFSNEQLEECNDDREIEKAFSGNKFLHALYNAYSNGFQKQNGQILFATLSLTILGADVFSLNIWKRNSSYYGFNLHFYKQHSGTSMNQQINQIIPDGIICHSPWTHEKQSPIPLVVCQVDNRSSPNHARLTMAQCLSYCCGLHISQKLEKEIVVVVMTPRLFYLGKFDPARRDGMPMFMRVYEIFTFHYLDLLGIERFLKDCKTMFVSVLDK